MAAQDANVPDFADDPASEPVREPAGDSVQPTAAVADLLLAMASFSNRMAKRVPRKEAGVGLGDWLMLHSLAGGPLKLVALTQLLGVSRQRVQKQVSALAEKGLVVTQGDPSDERMKSAELTDEGRSRLQEFDRLLARRTAALPQETLERGRRLIVRLSGVLDEKYAGKGARKTGGKAGGGKAGAGKAAGGKAAGGKAGKGKRRSGSDGAA